MSAIRGSDAGRGSAGRLGDYRNLAAIVLGLTLMQGAATALQAFGALTLAARGAPILDIGIAAAGYAFGFLVGALRATAVVRAIGHIRAFAAFAATAAIAALALHGALLLAVWTMLQACLGLCVSILLTSGESWIADAAPTERRGRLLAFYMVASKLGQVAGPAFVAPFFVAGAAGGFMVIAGLFAASLIPVSATRRSQPFAPSLEAFGLSRLWRTAPAALLAAFTAGAVNGSVLQLYPLFSKASGPGTGIANAAAFNAALAIGAIALQWPAGWLSDRTDRRMVIALLGATGALASLALLFGASVLAWPAILALAAAWGGGSLSFYGIAVAHAVDRSPPGHATGAMAGILVIWAIGAFVGPLIAGWLMSGPIGPRGLFAFAGLGLSALAASMIVRRLDAAPPPPAEKSSFVISPATSQALVLIDPRTDPSAPAGAAPTTPEAQP